MDDGLVADFVDGLGVAKGVIVFAGDGVFGAMKGSNWREFRRDDEGRRRQ